MGLFSEYCGLGESHGVPHHVTDHLCRLHDIAYQRILDHGGDPYTNWNPADEAFLKGLASNVPEGIREKIVAYAADKIFKFKRYMLAPPMSDIESDEEAESLYTGQVELIDESDEEETKEDTPMMQVVSAEGNTRAEGATGKRKKREEHGMEPSGHGNTPATGTEQAGYIQKYVPCNYPDKLTLKSKMIQTGVLYGNGGATNPTWSYIAINTNSMKTFLKNSFGYISTQGNITQPNQFTQWNGIYGYYRVQQMEYRITFENVASTLTVTPTTTTLAQYGNSAIVGTLPTQTQSDLTSPSAATNVGYLKAWEQKQAKIHYLPGHNVGSSGTITHMSGCISPEDYDIDPLTTAADETWTAIGSDPATPRLLGVFASAAVPWNTGNADKTNLHAVQVLIECIYTYQLAGYYPSLRQTAV